MRRMDKPPKRRSVVLATLPGKQILQSPQSSHPVRLASSIAASTRKDVHKLIQVSYHRTHRTVDAE